MTDRINKKTRILLTGVPGTGKTTLAKLISKIGGFSKISINAVARKSGSVKRGGEVNLRKLEGVLKAEIKRKGEKDIVLDGHLGCEIKLPLDTVFVLRCDPEKLKVRLRRRKYSKKKIEDNLLCEALDYCTVQAEKNFGRVVEIDTTHRSPITAAKLILAIARKRRKSTDRVNWKAWLEKMV
ncbi:MAG: adenylate kinase family protein [Candidatus Anstonellales archaeon]